MNALDMRKQVQILLGVTPDGDFGPKSLDALHRLINAKDESPWPPTSLPPTSEPRKISDDSLALIQHFEGLYLTAYQDSVGVWTIGWGHTGLTHQDGTVKKGRTITRAEAVELLKHDMKAFAARVERFVKVALNDDEFGALVSFDFNTGGLGRSTLLKKLNAGDVTGAADEFLKWDKAGGQTLRGLTRRRQSERNLFLGKRPFIVTS